MKFYLSLPPVLPSLRVLTALLCFVGLTDVRLHAQVEVSVSTLPRVGVSVGGAEGSLATQVLSADLKRTGMMTPVGSGSGEYQATGEASGGGVNGTLTNKRTGQSLFSQNFSGSTRTATHEFADAITKAVTGLPGFASSKLAFVAGGSSVKELWYGDIDGYGARPLTHDGVISASPALSRDGSKLAYDSYKSGYLDVYLIDLGSGGRNRIAFFPGINSGPAFSPDGARIALTLSKDGNPEIYTISDSGGDPVRITRTRGSETSPSWSPDGAQLVYSSDDHGSPQLYTSTAQGVGEMDHLVTNDSYCTKPDWSSDGRLIAFTTRIGGQFQIGVYSVGNRTAQVITSAGGSNPAWTRDSRHLVYDNGGRLFLLDTVSRQSIPLSIGASNCIEPTVSR